MPGAKIAIRLWIIVVATVVGSSLTVDEEDPFDQHDNIAVADDGDETVEKGGSGGGSRPSGSRPSGSRPSGFKPSGSKPSWSNPSTPSFPSNNWPNPTPSFPSNNWPNPTPSFPSNNWPNPTPSFPSPSWDDPTPSYTPPSYPTPPYPSPATPSYPSPRAPSYPSPSYYPPTRRPSNPTKNAMFCINDNNNCSCPLGDCDMNRCKHTCSCDGGRCNNMSNCEFDCSCLGGNCNGIRSSSLKKEFSIIIAAFLAGVSFFLF